MTSLSIAVIVVGMLQNLALVAQLALAARALAKRPPELESSAHWRRYASAAPPVSVLAPAYNEEASIVDSVKSLLALRYPNYEVIVVNDGSRDGTMAALQSAFELCASQRESEGRLSTAEVVGIYQSRACPRLLVIDKKNGGKADALNAGLNLARSPLVCAIDADSMLEPDALLRVVRPFMEDPDRVIAAGGAVRVGNGCLVDQGEVVTARAPRNWLALFQSVEYVRAFLLARLGLSSVGALTIISGAFGVFRRSAVLDAGGYRRDTVGEDMELVLRLHRRWRESNRAYRIVFVPEPACWTEAPETLAVLGRQRRRWQRGAIETFQRHAPMLFNPRYGRIGFAVLSSVLVVDVLGPIAELLGYVLVLVFAVADSLSGAWLLAFIAGNIVFGVALSVVALGLDDADLNRAGRTTDLARLLAGAVVEAFGYRQMNALWRAQGVWDWAQNRKAWGAMPRKGFRHARR
jgi:cellulose synthase/poly-beta-1,6-N-acetylglucosamine synthase-like glycosyltransferase